jgi:hypothetical protein
VSEASTITIRTELPGVVFSVSDDGVIRLNDHALCDLEPDEYMLIAAENDAAEREFQAHGLPRPNPAATGAMYLALVSYVGGTASPEMIQAAIRKADQ